MCEIRNKRPVSRIHKLAHNEDWNSSFWRYSMPKYDSTLDNHCKRIMFSANSRSTEPALISQPPSAAACTCFLNIARPAMSAAKRNIDSGRRTSVSSWPRRP